MFVSGQSIKGISTAIASGTNAGATATISANSTLRHHCLKIVGYTDLASTIQLKDGSTVLFTTQTGAGGFFLNIDGDYIGAVNTAMSAVLTSSTAVCSISISAAQL